MLQGRSWNAETVCTYNPEEYYSVSYTNDELVIYYMDYVLTDLYDLFYRFRSGNRTERALMIPVRAFALSGKEPREFSSPDSPRGRSIHAGDGIPGKATDKPPGVPEPVHKTFPRYGPWRGLRQ